MGGGTARMRAAVVAVAALALVGAPLPARACEPLPVSELVPTLAHPEIEQVVEHRFLAANPLPWGRSAAIVTRVWGPGLVERWITSDRNSHPCPDVVPMPPGTVMYSFPGSGKAEVYADEPVSDLDRAALETRFGLPETFEVSSVDRALAWVLVAPSWFIAAAVVVAVGTWGLVAWRRRRRDPYLF